MAFNKDNAKPLLGAVDEDKEVKGGTGTKFSSTFTLINAAVGTGMLTIPYSFKDAGIIPGILWILLYGLASGASLHVLVKSAHVSRTTSLPQLIGTYLGVKFQFVFEICLTLYCLLCGVGCMIVIADVGRPVLERLLPGSIFADLTMGPIVIKCIGALLMLPLQFLRRIASLRYTAYLAFASIIYICTLVIVHGAIQMPISLKSNEHVAWFPSSSTPWSVLFAVPNVAIAFQCQVQVVAIYAEMQTSIRSVGAMTSSIGVAVIVECVFYTCAGFFGYITFLGCTPSNILEANYSVDDYPVELARLCICIVMVTQFPIMHFPARKAIWTFLQKCACLQPKAPATSLLDEVAMDDEDMMFSPEVAPRVFSPPTGLKPSKKIKLEELPCCFFFTESILYWALSLGLAFVIPSLTVLFEILGFTMTMFILFTLPGIILYKSVGAMIRIKRKRTYKVIAFCLVLVGVVSTVISAYDFAEDVIVPLVTGVQPNALSATCENTTLALAPLF